MLTCLPVFAAGQVVEEIIARVNNQIVTRSEFVRSKDQLKDEVKQQDAANADKAYSEREKEFEHTTPAAITAFLNRWKA